MRTSRIKELLENDEFLKEVLEVVQRAEEKAETLPEKISYVFHSFADEEEGIIAVYYLGQFPIISAEVLSK